MPGGGGVLITGSVVTVGDAPAVAAPGRRYRRCAESDAGSGRASFTAADLSCSRPCSSGSAAPAPRPAAAGRSCGGCASVLVFEAIVLILAVSGRDHDRAPRPGRRGRRGRRPGARRGAAAGLVGRGRWAPDRRRCSQVLIIAAGIYVPALYALGVDLRRLLVHRDLDGKPAGESGAGYSGRWSGNRYPRQLTEAVSDNRPRAPGAAPLRRPRQAAPAQFVPPRASPPIPRPPPSWSPSRSWCRRHRPTTSRRGRRLRQPDAAARHRLRILTVARVTARRRRFCPCLRGWPVGAGRAPGPSSRR